MGGGIACISYQRKGTPVYYVLLIYGSEAVSAEMTQEERDELMQAHAAFAHETQERGLSRR